MWLDEEHSSENKEYLEELVKSSLQNLTANFQFKFWAVSGP